MQKWKLFRPINATHSMAKRQMHISCNIVNPQSSDDISFREKPQRKLKRWIEYCSIIQIQPQLGKN
jgi:hypothetical protein